MRDYRVGLMVGVKKLRNGMVRKLRVQTPPTKKILILTLTFACKEKYLK